MTLTAREIAFAIFAIISGTAGTMGYFYAVFIKSLRSRMEATNEDKAREVAKRKDSDAALVTEERENRRLREDNRTLIQDNHILSQDNHTLVQTNSILADQIK